MVCWKIIKLFEKKLKRKLTKEEKKEIQNMLHSEDIEYQAEDGHTHDNEEVIQIGVSA